MVLRELDKWENDEWSSPFLSRSLDNTGQFSVDADALVRGPTLEEDGDILQAPIRHLWPQEGIFRDTVWKWESVGPSA